MTGLEFIVISIIMAAISLGVSALVMLLAPKPDIEDAEPSGLGDYGFPTNLESRYIPVVWGSTRINGPNVIWYGDFRAVRERRDGNNVGFNYYIGIDMALCWGELDTITAIQLDDEFFIKAGEQRAHTAGVVPLTGFLKTASGYRSISVKDLNLTGGWTTGGGIEGDISFYYGTQNQPRNEYLARVLSDSGETETLANGNVVPRASLIPSYKGVARMVWEGGYLTDRATAPQFKVHVQRFPTMLTSSYAKIRDDGTTADANPMHVIYEILTDVDWGLAIDPSLINRASFIAAAKKCFEEGNGFSRTIDSPKQAFGVIQSISDQVNGVLFQNEDGLFEYSLNRKTYEETTNAILDYDKSAVGGTTYTTAALTEISGNTSVFFSGVGTIEYNLPAGADARLFPAGSDAIWAALEVGDEVLVRNVTEGSGVKPCVITSKGPVNSKYVYFASTTGEDLSADPLFFGGSIIATFQKDYDTVPKLTPASIIKIKTADRQAWDQTFNTVHLKYLDRTQEFRESIANAVDSGNMAIRKGKKSIKQVDMQGIRHPATAATVAQRFLKSYSYPLTTLSLEVSRDLSYLRPGSIVEVNHPDFGLFDFYMRVLEVSLPQDSSGNVVLKGMRDVFDEPLNSIQVGGSASLEVVVPTNAVVPTSIGLTGLPDFFHQKQGFSNTDVHTWHLLGAPNATTSSAQAFQLTEGGYTAVSNVQGLPPTGKIVGHTSDLWLQRDLSVASFPPVTRYNRYSSSTSAHLPGPYGDSPGPHTNPVRHNTNLSNTMVNGFSNNAMWGALTSGTNLYPSTTFYDKNLGDIIVRDLTVARGSLEVSNVTEGQIKNLGFALAIVRPAWANGDTRYEEVIAFTSAKSLDFYYRVGTVVPGFALRTGFEVIATSGGQLTENVVESYACLALSGVYRGLLDTGIQVLNSDSEILFLSQDDPMYDLVGQNVNSITEQTYRYEISSAGGQIIPEENTDQVVSADELKRRLRPMPPTLLRINSDTPGELWGRNDYSNGNYSAYTVKDVGTGTMTLNWSTHNHEVNPGVIKLYSETDAVETNERLEYTLYLIDDDRIEIATVGDRPDTNERNRHLLARLKEGWMPTTPPLRGGTEYVEGVNRTTLGFAASVEVAGGGHAGQGEVVDITARFNAMASGTKPELTFGEEYFVEVSVRAWDWEGGLRSRGAQRFGVRFTATANVTNP